MIYLSGIAFFGYMFPGLEDKYKTISDMTEKFNSICETIFQPKQDEKEQFKRQEEFQNSKKTALDQLTSAFYSDDIMFLLPLSVAYMHVKNKTGLDNLDIDEMYLTYYQLLLKG